MRIFLGLLKLLIHHSLHIGLRPLVLLSELFSSQSKPGHFFRLTLAFQTKQQPVDLRLVKVDVKHDLLVPPHDSSLKLAQMLKLFLSLSRHTAYRLLSFRIFFLLFEELLMRFI